MMGLSPRRYIPSFVKISLPVPEKKIFKGFLPYVGMAAILVMGPASCHQIFISLYLKAFIKNFDQIGKVVSEKIWFEFLYVHELGSMTLTFNTHIGEEPYKQFCFRSNPFILIMFTCTYLCNVKSCEIKYV